MEESPHFMATLRPTANSLIVTVPHEIVKILELRDGDICQFTVNKVKKEVNNNGLQN